ncbi:hypothetical protein E2562_030470 [Oryza meyeriana var. granulata]|uniref:Uncharacterized protein n=1 Tax=Oryza meyeriana var. granulata TaxID=110450 RepID=A0A6G1CKZ1_9ORYZ|nr:hypothetical protein E2562_030470 [Oryza meyeriana var. granulata]
MPALTGAPAPPAGSSLGTARWKPPASLILNAHSGDQRTEEAVGINELLRHLISAAEDAVEALSPLSLHNCGNDTLLERRAIELEREEGDSASPLLAAQLREEAVVTCER